MKRLVASVVLILAAAGCSHAAPAAQSTPVTAAEYAKFMHGVFPDSPYGDSQWITLGHDTCQALDNGLPPDQIRAVLHDELAANDAATKVILRASVATFCPNHSDEVPPMK